jgi:hypothetical protein
VIPSTTDDDKRLTYEVPEAGALLRLSRNASYEAAKRGDLGRATSQRFTLEQATNYGQIVAETDRMEQGYGTLASLDTFMNKSVGANLEALSNAWDNLLMAVAGPNSSNVVKALQHLTGALNWMQSQVLGMDPETLKLIAEGIGILGVALTAGGVVAILAAIGPAGWLIGGLAALGVALADEKLREGLMTVPTYLNTGIDYLVKLLMALPTALNTAIDYLINALSTVARRNNTQRCRPSAGH